MGAHGSSACRRRSSPRSTRRRRSWTRSSGSAARSSRCRTSAGGRRCVTSQFDEAEGLFVHPVQNERVMAGNGTIGLELAEDLPDADAVLVPWGGGGLFTGIASALAARCGPDVRCIAVQPETGAAVAAALEAGEPRESRVPAVVRRRRRREGRAARDVGAGAAAARRRLRCTLDETAAAVRLLAERMRVIAEGAGALAVAAALSGQVPGGSSSASSRAATSTPTGCRRSSRRDAGLVLRLAERAAGRTRRERRVRRSGRSRRW